MSDYLEVWKPAGPELVPLEGERVTLGKDPSNSVAVEADARISRLHAVLERFPAGWVVRDLGSTNGTWVNGERILGERVVHGGDELRIGDTRIVIRSRSLAVSVATEGAPAAPEITPRERDVLLALCRPVLSGSLLTEPSTVRQIASELFLTESAVKKHLLRLYDKFGLHDDSERRRGKLANEAITRGAVSLADLRRSEQR